MHTQWILLLVIYTIILLNTTEQINKRGDGFPPRSIADYSFFILDKQNPYRMFQKYRDMGQAKVLLD